MSARDDGGPAFPVHPDAHRAYDDGYAVLAGMTLRDYFAAKALPVIQQRLWAASAKDVAQEAYKVADAMLAMRSKPQP